MAKRFSSPFLFRIRNQIPITKLIEEVLKISWKISEGHFRFLCPLCSEFNTATNPRTNLARCFRCKKNFNPIDMVMIVNRCDFIEAVKLLKTLLPEGGALSTEGESSLGSSSSRPYSDNTRTCLRTLLNRSRYDSLSGASSFRPT